MRRFQISLFLLCLAACAGTSPEDIKMSNALNEQGKTLLAENKNQEALDIYRSALARNEKNAHAWNGLGVTYDLLGKPAKAKEAYQQAIDLQPDDLIAVNNLAHLYIEEGNPETAVQLLTPYVNDPTAPPTLRQNLSTATQAVQTKGMASAVPYADLGSYPTRGMAEAVREDAHTALGNGGEKVIFALTPEVENAGGTPVFALKASGRSPQKICDAVIPQNISCTVRGK